MGLDEVMGFVDAIIENEDDEESGGDNTKSSNYQRCLNLYQRMNLVVKVLIREKRKEEATRYIVAFFKNFEDFGDLEKAVENGESLITKPRTAPNSTKLEPASDS